MGGWISGQAHGCTRCSFERWASSCSLAAFFLPHVCPPNCPALLVLQPSRVQLPTPQAPTRAARPPRWKALGLVVVHRHKFTLHTFNCARCAGPNTGGKTASLKALGLAAVAARCGLPVPAAAPAKLPCFDAVLADIGESLDACQTGFADLFSRSGWLKLVSLLEVFSRVHSSASVHSINSRAAAVGNRLHCMTRHHGLLPPPI